MGSPGINRRMFESLVNTEGFQTSTRREIESICLRVLLIQKDFKHSKQTVRMLEGLRVLLIQKDFKLNLSQSITFVSLRVLLIQKDFKHNGILWVSGEGLRVLLIQKDFKPDEGLGTIGKNHIQSSSNSSSQNCSFSLL